MFSLLSPILHLYYSQDSWRLCNTHSGFLFIVFLCGHLFVFRFTHTILVSSVCTVSVFLFAGSQMSSITGEQEGEKKRAAEQLQHCNAHHKPNRGNGATQMYLQYVCTVTLIYYCSQVHRTSCVASLTSVSLHMLQRSDIWVKPRVFFELLRVCTEA